MLSSIATSLVEGLWIGFGFAVALCVFFAVLNIYFAYRAIRDERRRGIRVSLWKQPDFLRVLGLCLFMFNGLFLVIAATRGSSGDDALVITGLCIEVMALLVYIRAIVVVRQRRRASA